MKFKWILLFLLCVSSAHAQMYRWVDADGRITFSDKPPPAKYLPKEHDVSSATQDSSDSGLNFTLSEAKKNFPVTMYTSNECSGCDEGRALLKKRGIPFSEKTIQTVEDVKQLKQISGGEQLPYLTVGRNAQTGFNERTWNSALTAVGYPETSQLPSNYKFADPVPAAPPAEKKPVPKPVESPAPEEVPRPAEGTPPGFRF
jgi:glutaredoxin